MKYFSFLLIALWMGWACYKYGNVKSSDGYALWILALVSITYLIVYGIYLLLEFLRQKN